MAIDSEADERALMLVDGEASSTASRSSCSRCMCLRRAIVPLLSSASAARAMLMGGGAFATPRHVWWNFVSSTRERINEAKSDWRALRFPLPRATMTSSSRCPRCRRRSAIRDRVPAGRAVDRGHAQCRARRRWTRPR